MHCSCVVCCEMAFVGAEKFLGINGYLEGIGHSLDFGQTLIDLIITLGFFLQ